VAPNDFRPLLMEPISIPYGDATLELYKSATHYAAIPGGASSLIGPRYGSFVVRELGLSRGGRRPSNMLAVDRALEEVRRDQVTATHVYHTSDRDLTPWVPTGDVRIAFEGKVTRPDQAAILARHHLVMVGEMSMDDQQVVHARITTESRNPIVVTRDLLQERVIWAEPDLVTPFRTSPPPADSIGTSTDQWYLHNVGSSGGISYHFTRGADIGAALLPRELLDRGHDGPIVAVVDREIDVSHPGLASSRIAGRFDAGSGGTRAASDFSRAHGTACAGLIAGRLGSFRGVVPGCPIMPITWDGQFSPSSMVAMLDYARENGARVVNFSWTPEAHVFRLCKVVAFALKRLVTRGSGTLLCVSMGNEGRHVDGRTYVNQLAAFPGVIGVSSLNAHGQVWSNSNYGPSTTVGAPGCGAPEGPSMVTLDSSGAAGLSPDDLLRHGFGGTSAACALVSGVSALALLARPSLGVAELRDLLVRTSKRPVPFSPKHPQKSGADAGFGCVNASAVVSAIAPALKG
jgi:Subtilase family